MHNGQLILEHAMRNRYTPEVVEQDGSACCCWNSNVRNHLLKDHWESAGGPLTKEVVGAVLLKEVGKTVVNALLAVHHVPAKQ